MEFWESYILKRFNLIQLISFKRCMAFDGRTDPNNGYEEKSPCTSKVLERGGKIIVLIEIISVLCCFINIPNMTTRDRIERRILQSYKIESVQCNKSSIEKKTSALDGIPPMYARQM
jgi:hypothetical protein